MSKKILFDKEVPNWNYEHIKDYFVRRNTKVKLWTMDEHGQLATYFCLFLTHIFGMERPFHTI